MARRSKEAQAVVRSTLEAHGIRRMEFSKTRGGHQRVEYFVGGMRRRYVFSFSPSDTKALLAIRTTLRRQIVEARG